MEFKYECSTMEWLEIESGMKPAPNDKIIVNKATGGDLALVEDNIYKFYRRKWVFVKKYNPEEDE